MRSTANRSLALCKAPTDDPTFQLILEASPDLIYVYDRMEERYLFASERSTTMLGYTPQQFVQLTSEDVQQLIHPEDLAHAKAHYAKQEAPRQRDLDDDLSLNLAGLYEARRSRSQAKPSIDLES